MRKAVKGIGLCALAFPLLGMATVDLQSPHVPGELIIKLKDGVNVSRFTENKGLGAQWSKSYHVGFGELVHIKVSDKADLGKTISNIASMEGVQYVEPNYIYTVGNPIHHNNFVSQGEDSPLAPNDPRFGQLWGLNNTGNNSPDGSRGVAGADIQAFRAWDISKGDRRVKVAIIDTGIDYNHEDIKANMWTNEAEANGKAGVDDDKNGYIDDVHGYDFANKDGDPLDGHGHGTHCSGTIGAVHDNGIGVAGVMANVTMVGVKFLTDAGSGTTADAVLAIDYATKLDVDIMSNSWGGGGRSEALFDAIKRASDKGILFVAAAGNSSSDNDQTPNYPSNYEAPNVVAVAAHTNGDGLASFSSYGQRTVHVAAPGHKILSTVTNNGYDVYSGTSMATPHVSGVLGLLLSKEGGLTVAEVKERLLRTSEPIRAYRKKTISGGRINAYNLLTNTRPVSREPDPSAWHVVRLEKKFETDHPYLHGQNVAREFVVPGAKYVRARIKRYDLESGYDFLKVTGKARNEIESMSGAGADYVTDFVDGDTLRLEFTSDSSVSKWGFLVEELEAVLE
ncbi:MAG: hypothetical protein A2X86_01220 [Bdellovibrionales bacterium GWA2_49_15]|nr:MAG: hypothetical protein A2X86_01220 [Bdellovibrionales bacterium GWA2_49_15]HAZ12155.1 subtilase [Bdellovibrionales bacterium]